LLVTMCKTTEVRFPDFDSWQVQANGDLEDERAKSRNILKMAYEAGGDFALLARKMQAEIAKLEAEKRLLKAERVERKNQRIKRSLPQPTRPVKIGRNDPCRCGSGKKFKV